MGYHEELLGNLRVRMAQVSGHGEWRFSGNGYTPLPIGEAELLTRSVDGAAKRIELAQKSGFLSNPCSERGPEIDLSTVHSSVFVLKGQDHHALREDCQDAVIIDQNENRILAVCADGVGSVPFSDIGSTAMVRAFVHHAGSILRTHSGSILDSTFLGRLHAALYLEQHAWTMAAGLSPKDAFNLFLATTLQFAIITPSETLLAGLGDGSVTLHGHTFPALERSFRQEILHTSRVPPLLAAAYCHERAIPELLKDLDTFGARRTTGEPGPTREELEAGHIVAQFTEAGAFYIYGHGSTQQLLSDGIELTTDGVAFTDWNNVSTEARFPLRALLSMTEPEAVTALAQLHNLVTLPDHYSIDRLDDSLARWLKAVLHRSKSLPPTRFYEICRESLTRDREIAQTLKDFGLLNLSELFDEGQVINPGFEHAAPAIRMALLSFAKRFFATQLESRGLTVHHAPPLRDDISVVRCRLHSY
jgi:hypothetical protein